MWSPNAVIALLIGLSVAVAQRKISRNISVNNEAKTPVNFDCPEEFGYYPHPSDCTQYYVCVFGGALLESCTGGLMYSHELQTCDWPRNVGCDGTEGGTQSVAPAVRGRDRDRELPPPPQQVSRVRYGGSSVAPPPPPPAPAAVVTSRGQPRPHKTQHEIIKQQQQLYADAEESLPPAEEIESDRQQRVYRGQPSTIGQVQRDRDGLRHTNAIPSYSGRGEKIGVISFGTQQQPQNIQEHYSEETSEAQAQVPTATASPRNIYNTTQYNNHYDPYYALYDDDVELYRDVGHSPQSAYRGGTSTPAVQSTVAQEDNSKRGNTVYIQNNYNPQDIYQQSTSADYSEDNAYIGQVDENTYKQNNRQPSSLRGDRNEINDVEEAVVRRKPVARFSTTSTTTTSTTTTAAPSPRKTSAPLSGTPVTAAENQTHAQSVISTLAADPGQVPPTPSPIRPDPKQADLDDTRNTANKSSEPAPTQNSAAVVPHTYRPRYVDAIADTSLHAPAAAAPLTKKPSPFSLNAQPRTNTRTAEPVRLLGSTDPRILLTISRPQKTIVPTTYSPPKFFLKSILPKAVGLWYDRVTAARTSTTTESTTYKTLKNVRKQINPFNVNELAVTSDASVISSSTESSEEPSVSFETPAQPIKVKKLKIYQGGVYFRPTTTSSTTTERLEPEYYEPRSVPNEDDDYVNDRLVSFNRHYNYSQSNLTPKAKFRGTVEVPPPEVLAGLLDEPEKPVPDQPPSYKLVAPSPTTKTIDSTTPVPPTSPTTTRASRVNAAIKQFIAVGGGTQRPNVKCHVENHTTNTKCNNDPKPRTSLRGRGSAHYAGSGGNIANNEVTVNTNRGTPAPRSRPTLKPSTSIVSKASEFIDIYKFPPRRPDPIYPQPQPDKTAAKCRKDVCLLPDCSCGGKEIPGDLPVEQVPQLVLITYDDSVNDLNKGLYSDLFEKGRTNPNGCPITATFYVSHEWTDYSQVQNLYSDGHEIASHTVSHSFGEQFSQKKWTREVAGQREILSAYGGVHLEDVRGMRAPFLSVGGNKMFKMLYDSNFTYDSSMPIYENKPPSWPYTLDYKLFHDCMIPPCPTRSYPGVWEVPMVMWQDLNGGRCSMGDACSNPPDSEGVLKMLMKNFQRHYTTNRAPFGLFYHAAWFTQPHHKEGFINFIDTILGMKDVWLVTNWQALQWVRNPTPASRLGSFQPFQCDYSDRPKRCNNPKVCNLWHKSGVRYMRTCQPCPDIYPWTGNTGIRSSRIDNDIED